MSVISDNLIHFLARQHKDFPNKQFEIFKLIIQDGLRTGPVFIKYSDGNSVHNHIICFTDIPLRDCNQHTSIYGKFGLGFKKSYIKNVGGNPARYFVDYLPGQTFTESMVESRGSLYYNLCLQNKYILQLNELIKTNPNFELFDIEGNRIFSTEQIKEFVQSLIFSFSFDKEMGDLGPARDDTREIDLFYKEHEWRLVPSKLAALSGAAKMSADGSSLSYLFKREHVNMVVVPNEELRICVLDYFLELRNSSDDRLKQFGIDILPVITYDDLHRW
ncbi:MAG: abortive infection system antitoxin AbiGi family protein [Methylomicrobium sp.]